MEIVWVRIKAWISLSFCEKFQNQAELKTERNVYKKRQSPWHEREQRKTAHMPRSTQICIFLAHTHWLWRLKTEPKRILLIQPKKKRISFFFFVFIHSERSSFSSLMVTVYHSFVPVINFFISCCCCWGCWGCCCNLSQISYPSHNTSFTHNIVPKEEEEKRH